MFNYYCFNCSSFQSIMAFYNQLTHLLICDMPFLCCSYLVVCSTFFAIQISNLFNKLSLMQSLEQIVLANRTQPACNLGSSLNMLGYLDLGLGTEDGAVTFGAGGGRGAMFIPFMPGMVAVEQLAIAVGMVSKLQGTLLTGGAVCLGGLAFFYFLSFFIFLCLSFFLFQFDLELLDRLSESLSYESELYLSFFFFLSSLSLSFFLSFLLSLSFSLSFSFSFSLFFFLSPIYTTTQILQTNYYVIQTLII